MLIKTEQINCQQETAESYCGGRRSAELGQKSDSMFATIIHTALGLLFLKLFYLLYFGQNSFSILMREGGGYI